MKLFFSILFSLTTTALWSQIDTTAVKTQFIHATYQKHNFTLTAAIGFVDQNRQTYTVPQGYTKGIISGFAPFFAKLEYGLTNAISIAATLCHDAYLANYGQTFTGNNGTFTRYNTNNTRIFSGGLTAFWHLQQYIHVRRLDPFVGVGLCINNIRYSQYPQGDTTTVKYDHTLTLYLKAGARYYITDKFSLFGDLGYDRQSYLTIGASCRFNNKRPF